MITLVKAKRCALLLATALPPPTGRATSSSIVSPVLTRSAHTVRVAALKVITASAFPSNTLPPPLFGLFQILSPPLLRCSAYSYPGGAEIGFALRSQLNQVLLVGNGCIELIGDRVVVVVVAVDTDADARCDVFFNRHGAPLKRRAVELALRSEADDTQGDRRRGGGCGRRLARRGGRGLGGRRAIGSRRCRGGGVHGGVGCSCGRRIRGRWRRGCGRRRRRRCGRRRGRRSIRGGGGRRPCPGAGERRCRGWRRRWSGRLEAASLIASVAVGAVAVVAVLICFPRPVAAGAGPALQLEDIVVLAAIRGDRGDQQRPLAALQETGMALLERHLDRHHVATGIERGIRCSRQKGTAVVKYGDAQILIGGVLQRGVVGGVGTVAQPVECRLADLEGGDIRLRTVGQARVRVVDAQFEREDTAMVVEVDVGVAGRVALVADRLASRQAVAGERRGGSNEPLQLAVGLRTSATGCAFDGGTELGGRRRRRGTHPEPMWRKPTTTGLVVPSLAVSPATRHRHPVRRCLIAWVHCPSSNFQAFARRETRRLLKRT